MANLTFKQIQIKGIASCVPSNIEYNENYHLFKEGESKKFIESTGVYKRHIASSNICTSDLCEYAANDLIKNLDINRESIDLLIFVSQTSDYILPATSVILQNKLKLYKNTAAFDINLGCTGYVYGLATVFSFLQNPIINSVLLMVGEKLTHITSRNDKTIYPLFGDAGTATYITKGDASNNSFFNLYSDGAGYKELIIEAGGCRVGTSSETVLIKEYANDVKRNQHHLFMNGPEIFNFTIREVPKSIKSLLEFSETSIEDIDYFVYHQANKFMIDFLAKKSKLPKEKVPISLDKYGNTSSATIPLTICSELRDISKSKVKLLLSSFGVGLSWANAIINLENCYLSKVLEF